MPANAILNTMLQRLFASMARGASLNCRPHASRLRLDLTLISRFKDMDGAAALQALLSEKRSASVAARVPMPEGLKLRFGDERFPAADLELLEGNHAGAIDETPLPLPPEGEVWPKGGAKPRMTGGDPATNAWLHQRALLTKLRNLSDESRTYEQDTGVHALHIGYPVLSLPPGEVGASAGGTSRVLAPIAFIPVSLAVRTGHKSGLELSCYGQGVDLVIPNAGLFAWLERQTGKPTAPELADEHGDQPWDEICALVKLVCARLGMDVPEGIGLATGEDREESHATGQAEAAPRVSPFTLEELPKAEGLANEARIYRSAVLGLYPMSNEALLRDTQAMLEAKKLDGPVVSFLDSKARLEAPPVESHADGSDHPVEKSARQFVQERLIAQADPCQSRTVAKARQARGLVIHGPPGTGKSQTITNIIGDHLARGERVLFVCDKRTALDVVFNRLDHIGLGELCALVHDPHRDQRDLYMSIRAQLDQLADVKTNAKAERELTKIDDELQRLHGELTDIHNSLMVPPPDAGAHAPSFHELMGEWLSISPPTSESGGVCGEEVRQATLDELEQREAEIELMLRRGVSVNYPQNAWASCVGIELDAFMARQASEMRRGLASCVEDARAADATRHAAIPPFNARQTLAEQARMRQELASRLQRVIDSVDQATAKCVSEYSAETGQRVRRQLADVKPHVQIVREGAEDSELTLIAREHSLGPAAIAKQLGALAEYLAIASKWHAFLHFGAKSRAANVLRGYGLALSIDSAERVRRFLNGLRARVALRQVVDALMDAGGIQPQAVGEIARSDEELIRAVEAHEAALDAFTPAIGLEELEELVRGALRDFNAAMTLIDGLKRSPARAAALEQLEGSLRALNLFDSNWLANAAAQFRVGKKATETFARLEEQFDTLEGVIRIRHELARLPSAFRKSVEAQLRQSIEPETGMQWLRRGVLEGEIARRLNADPNLKQIDADRIASLFDRYGELDERKRRVVRDVILHHWRSKQKERLLVSTGTRLNSEGAKLRQRLFVRGKRAMRLRQVIALGRQGLAGGEAAELTNFADDTGREKADSQGTAPHEDFSSAADQDSPSIKSSTDPLFDLCPIWMASPSTVAQIFPLEPVFDVVVFDEASQCKLEEALPVLVRAKRVVVAGDPKQLPPTRFFEAGIAESEHIELETDQDMFEAQQGEIEDLLAASLILEIEESYLDVHYRSRNADLIEFSNEQFYGNRLQAIPGHPAKHTQFAPITMYRVDGVYENRCNPAEARRVCEIVRDLLKRANPPSIGIACFNLMQRDLIVEMLDDLALEDAPFASKLSAARERRGEGSFEGLFVKNLENVQGDERDHIIISTTYGPNEKGKFYRRFGPLGMPGGGRRLNVLVTRARHEVHLVTSIPREAYRSAPPVPPGQTPNGGWLLFSYLCYAESLAEQYELNHRILSEAQAQPTPQVFEREIQPFSAFCKAVAYELAANHAISSDVHWGNEGFRIELALHHPHRAEDVTIGVLCDFAQYRRAQDPVEWDLFRASIHESQGWKLHRMWSPQYFRDSQRAINGIVREVKAFLSSEERTKPKA